MVITIQKLSCKPNCKTPFFHNDYYNVRNLIIDFYNNKNNVICS